MCWPLAAKRGRESPYGPSIIFISDHLTNLPIPGADYTFAQLDQAISLSEYDSLVHWERPIIRLHLAGDLPAALDQLAKLFKQARHRLQP